jgi:hypothetical protein
MYLLCVVAKKLGCSRFCSIAGVDADVEADGY